MVGFPLLDDEPRGKLGAGSHPRSGDEGYTVRVSKNVHVHTHSIYLHTYIDVFIYIYYVTIYIIIYIYILYNIIFT